MVGLFESDIAAALAVCRALDARDALVAEIPSADDVELLRLFAPGDTVSTFGPEGASLALVSPVSLDACPGGTTSAT